MLGPMQQSGKIQWNTQALQTRPSGSSCLTLVLSSAKWTVVNMQIVHCKRWGGHRPKKSHWTEGKHGGEEIGLSYQTSSNMQHRTAETDRQDRRAQALQAGYCMIL